ncbi:MAG: hypothetical protein KKA19_08015, partial [Candidatus Margulisbacteria bacterium]|nr:hypothetical protein [Candidatus Margulisiibacteriota bacterium]
MLFRIIVILVLLISFTSTTYAVDYAAQSLDPGYMGTSAKTLGMGRAFVAVADDVNAVFYNPAGLAQLEHFQIMSMTNTSLLLGELKYTTAALAFPVGFGALGIGVVSKRIEGIPLLGLADVTANNRPDADKVEYGNYEDNTTYISYGLDIGTESQFKLLKNMAVGLTLKTFNKRGYGEGELLEDAQANGTDFDLGWRSNLDDNFSLGFNLRNFFPAKDRFNAGTLYWNTGEREAIMDIYTFGAALKMYDGQLILAADTDVFAQNVRPALGHFGLQWHFSPYMYFRTGWDQIPLPASNKSRERVENIMPIGIGLEYFGFAIDYAYYPAYNLQDNATHFVSLAFTGFEFEDTKKDETTNAQGTEGATTKEETLLILDGFPPQKVVYEESVEVTGSAQGYEKVQIGNQVATVNNGVFSTKVPLVLGKNEIDISVADRKIKRNVLRLPNVKEIREKGFENDLKYVLSLPDFATFYKPNQSLSRQQLANWIISAKGMKLTDNLQGIFSEMDLLTIKGYMDAGDDGLVNPDEILTRGKMAVALAYLEGMKDAFLGVPLEQKQTHAMELLKEAGQYNEDDFLPRDKIINLHDAAKLMARTSIINLEVKKLTAGFVVPQVFVEPRRLNSGDSLKIQVTLPTDVTLKDIVVRVEKEKYIPLKKITERLYLGEWKIPPERKKGFYPIAVSVEDINGNKNYFTDYY